jgi:hypothetical protein
MPTSIIDFTSAQQEHVANLLEQRYNKTVDLQLADSELPLDTETEELTTVPTLYWSERGAQFVVFKIDEARYRCLYFYSEAEQFGTGHEEYDDLEKCVISLLQVQADHERQLSSMTSASTTAAREVNKYPGPIVISRDM